MNADDWAGFRARHMLNAMRALPIEAQAAESAREIIALEYQLNEEVHCQHSHKPGTVPCSINVTHRIVGCKGAGLICSAGAGHEQRKINEKYTCMFCLRPAESCWRVEPWG